MKNPVKLVKIVRFKLALVTTLVVAFLVTASITFAAWVGPPGPPPDDNLPGFIFNDTNVQSGNLHIDGKATVNTLEVGLGGVVGDLDMQGNRIFDLADPTGLSDDHAATKAYVDSAIGGVGGDDGDWIDDGTNLTSGVTGNVRIGTFGRSPVPKLEVDGGIFGEDTGTTFYAFYGEGQTASDYGMIGVPSIGVLGNSNTAGVKGVSPSGKAVWGFSSSSGYGGYFDGKGYFSGDVGIGTENTGSDKFRVDGDARIGDIFSGTPVAESGGNRLYFSGNQDTSITYDSENSDAMFIQRYNTGDNASEFRVNVSDDIQAADKFVIGIRGLSTWEPKFTVNMLGNVGIGDPTPTRKLDIAGDIRTQTLGKYSKGAICGADGTQCFNFNNNTWVYIGDTDGNVYGGKGLAATNLYSASNLYGRGNTRLSGSVYNDQTTNGGNLYLNDNVQVTGNLGIGTSIPGEKLHVRGELAVGTYLANPNPGLSTRGVTLSTINFRMDTYENGFLNNLNAGRIELQNANTDGSGIFDVLGRRDTQLAFSTMKDNVLTEKMIIREDGNIRVAGSICDMNGANCFATTGGGSSGWVTGEGHVRVNNLNDRVGLRTTFPYGDLTVGSKPSFAGMTRRSAEQPQVLLTTNASNDRVIRQEFMGTKGSMLLTYCDPYDYTQDPGNENCIHSSGLDIGEGLSFWPVDDLGNTNGSAPNGRSFSILSDGNVEVGNDLTVSDNIYLGDIGDTYLFRGATDRIDTYDSFYVRAGSIGTYLYSDDTYLGGTWGDNIRTRGNPVYIGKNSPSQGASTGGLKVYNYTGDTGSDGIKFYEGGTRMGEIGTTDTTWLRINQRTDKNVYTPRMFRADGGFQVDGNYVIDSNAGWHRTYGATGWYNGTYGGGWYMTDTNYVRNYNNIPISINSNRSNSGFFDSSAFTGGNSFGLESKNVGSNATRRYGVYSRAGSATTNVGVLGAFGSVDPSLTGDFGVIGITGSPTINTTYDIGVLGSLQTSGSLTINGNTGGWFAGPTTGSSYGVFGQGATMGGRFEDTNNGSWAYLANGGYGLKAGGDGYLSGNLGVGVDPAEAKLHVGGDARVDGLLQILNNDLLVGNTLTVDDSLRKVHVGVPGSIVADLVVTGNLETASVDVSIRSGNNGNYFTNDDSVITCSPNSTTGNIRINLNPAANNEGMIFTLKKTNGNPENCIFDAGNDRIDGFVSRTLKSNRGYMTVISDGDNWLIISEGGN